VEAADQLGQSAEIDVQTDVDPGHLAEEERKSRKRGSPINSS
jgi:hypothetical protein